MGPFLWYPVHNVEGGDKMLKFLFGTLVGFVRGLLFKNRF